MNTRFLASTSILILSVATQVLLAADAVPPPSAPKPVVARPVEWDELLPREERENFNAAPPAAVHDYLGGGPAARQQGSFNTNLALNGAAVKIPGFVVPLDMNPDDTVKEFFLVPYFGACIHVPPPPPNQIVYVRLATGVRVRSMYDAQWVTGRLRIETKNSRYGAAAYTLDGEKVDPYKY